MRIIKHGDTYVEYFHECLKCHCTFAYISKDICLGYEPLQHIRTYYIYCPECNEQITIKTEKRNKL